MAENKTAAPLTEAPAAPRRGLPRASAERKSITLSNGAVVEYREPTGMDMEKAHMSAGDRGNYAVMVACCAQVATVDGEAFPFEAWLQAKAGEIGKVIEAVVGNDPSSAPAT